MNNTLRLTDQKVLERVQNLLAEHLPLSADGYTCPTEDLLKVLLSIVPNTGTLESVCADLVGAPDSETIRTYFNTQLQVADWTGQLWRNA